MNQIQRYIKDAKKNPLIKVSGKNAFPVILQFFVGLFKIKLISAWLGTAGMALFSQFENFFQLSTNVSSAGINQGITKLYAIATKEEKKDIASTALVITVATTIILSTILFIFSKQLSIRLMQTADCALLIKCSGIFVFLFCIANIIRNALKGQKKHNSFIAINIFEIIISFIFIAGGAYYGVKTALWCLMFSAASVGIFALIRNSIFHFPITFSKPVVKRLSGFSIMFIIAAVIAPLLQIILRSIIFQHCSIEEAGWWDGVRRISRTYISLITATIGLYFLPRISEISTNKELRKELRNTLTTIIPFVAIGSLTIFLCKDLIIHILFSKEFVPMRSLFLFQCGTDFLKVISWLLATTLLMREKITYYIFSELFMFVFIIATNFLLISRWGIEVSTLASFISNIVYLLLLAILWQNAFCDR